MRKTKNHKVSAVNFIGTVIANVDNEKLSDADFRDMLRNTLSIVEKPHIEDIVNTSLRPKIDQYYTDESDYEPYEVSENEVEVCNGCGHTRDNHPYRHPFIPNKILKTEQLKTSEEWFNDIAEEGFIIMDPDGWDRTNYQYSFYEEKITHSEYMGRVLQSTCIRTIKKP